MTVSSTTTKVSYSGDGSTTVFAYTFKVFNASDLVVIKRTDSTGSESVQTITTNYTVSGVGNANGGNVTFVTAPATGETVVIRRTSAQTQTTDYTPNDPFPASAHEEALDKLTFMVQEQQEELDRSIKVSRTNTITSSEFTVGATDRANRVFAFDSDGDLSVTQEIGTYQGTDATTTTSNYQERDLIKSTTAAELNNVYICIADSVAGDLLTDTDHFELIIDAVSAATSATNAATSATTATTKATEAATSATNAATSASNASTSETNASTSETNAATSATNAATSETNAGTSETNAATSATSASTSATTATTKASEASTSATNAATSATTATTKASEASTSATNAATSETNAATSATSASTAQTAAETAQTAAETAQTAAETAQAAAELAADNFDDTYLGAKSSDPTVDNDGDALTAGDLYFNTTSNNLKVYTGSAWADAALDASSFIASSGGTLTGNLNFGDNNKAQFGAGNDLQIFHDGTHSRINEVGTGNLRISAQDFHLVGDSDGEIKISATQDGSVTLGYNNGTKLATTASGIDVTGTVTMDGGSTSADFSFGDSDKALFGAGNDLQVYHDGTNSYILENGTGNLIVKGNAGIYLRGTNDENMGVFLQDGASTLYHNNAAKIATSSTGVTVTGTALATTNTDTTNSGSVTLDFGANQNFVLTLTGNVTLANPTTEQTGQSGFIIFIQDGTGSRTVSLGSDYETAGGAGLTLSTAASSVDIVPYVVQSSGNILLGAPQLAFS